MVLQRAWAKGQLPPEDLRGKVDAAIQSAVSLLTGEDGDRLCLLYAASVALVAAAVSPDPPKYGIHLGRLVIRVNETDAIVHDPQQGGFHAWTGFLNDDGTGELIDLSLRHYADVPGREGKEWVYPRPPDFLWCSPEQRPANIMYTVDPELMSSLSGMLKVMHPAIKEVVNESLTILYESQVPLWRGGEAMMRAPED